MADELTPLFDGLANALARRDPGRMEAVRAAAEATLEATAVQDAAARFAAGAMGLRTPDQDFPLRVRQMQPAWEVQACFLQFSSLTADAGLALLESDDPELGLAFLESALKRRPYDKKLHARLRQATAIKSPHAARLERIERAHRLEPLHSFGDDLMEYPYSIGLFPGSDLLALSDIGRRSLHLFSTSGQRRGELRGPWKSVFGIFPGESGSIWVCDKLAGEVLRCNATGEILARVPLRGLQPEFGCHCGDVCHVAATDSAGKLHVVSFTAAGDGPTRTVLNNADSQPAGLHHIDGKLLLGRHQPSGLLTLLPQSGGQAQALSLPPPYVFQFAPMGEYAFATLPMHVCKFRLADGETLFDAELMAIPGIGAMSAQGIAVEPSGDGGILYVADYLKRRIHAFRV